MQQSLVFLTRRAGSECCTLLIENIDKVACVIHWALQEIADGLHDNPPDPLLPKDQQQMIADKREEKRKAAQKPVESVQYSVKAHKRKGAKNAVCIAYALHDLKANKQIVQLTETANPDAKSIVEGVASGLNDGTMSKEEGIAAVNSAKG